MEEVPQALPGMEGRLNKPKADQALLAQQAAMADEDLPCKLPLFPGLWLEKTYEKL